MEHVIGSVLVSKQFRFRIKNSEFENPTLYHRDSHQPSYARVKY